MAAALSDVPAGGPPEALQLTDGRPFDRAAGPMLAELQRLLNVEFPPRPGQMPTVSGLASVGCLASAIMDMFAQRVNEMDSGRGRGSWHGELARLRTKAFTELRSSIRKAHKALPPCDLPGALPGARRRTRRRSLLSRVRGLRGRRSTRRAS